MISENLSLMSYSSVRPNCSLTKTTYFCSKHNIKLCATHIYVGQCLEFLKTSKVKISCYSFKAATKLYKSLLVALYQHRIIINYEKRLNYLLLFHGSRQT